MALRTPAFNDAKTYGFEWLRYAIEVDNQEGVVGPNDLKVTAAAGGGMRVDIAAGTALVKGDSGAPGTGVSQGLFLAVNDAAVPNAVTLAGAHATLPRVDSIIMRVRDSSDLGSGADDAIFDFVTGVATSGATLDNRAGAAALPNDAVLLGDVLVPAASVAVTAVNVRDRRKWARGGLGQVEVAGNSTAAGLTPTAILQQRFECAGNPIRVSLEALSIAHTTVGQYVQLSVLVDGANFPGTPSRAHTTTAGFESNPAHTWVLGGATTPPPAAGSHLIALGLGASAATGTLAGPARFTVEEILRPNANNGLT